MGASLESSRVRNSRIPSEITERFIKLCEVAQQPDKDVAFKRAVDDLYRPFQSFAQAVLTNHLPGPRYYQTREDLVQELALKMLNREKLRKADLTKIREKGAESYLAKALTRMTIDWLRRRRTRYPEILLEPENLNLKDANLPGRDYRDPISSSEAREQIKLIKEIAKDPSGLTASMRQRQPIILEFLLAGRTARDLADHLRVSPSQASALMKKFKDRLAKKVQSLNGLDQPTIPCTKSATDNPAAG